MKKDLVIGLLTMAFAAACVIELATAKKMFVMEDQVSASFFPYLMIGLLGFLGLMLTISASSAILRARSRGEAVATRTDWEAMKQRYQVPMLMFLITAAYIFLIPVIGFYTMSVVYFIALGLLLGGISPRVLLKVSGGAAGVVLIIYLLFEVSLQMYMPTGLFR